MEGIDGKPPLSNSTVSQSLVCGLGGVLVLGQRGLEAGERRNIEENEEDTEEGVYTERNSLLHYGRFCVDAIFPVCKIRKSMLCLGKARCPHECEECLR